MRQLGLIIEAALAENDYQTDPLGAENNVGRNYQPFAVKSILWKNEAIVKNLFDGYPSYAPVAMGNQYRTNALVSETEESSDESNEDESEFTAIKAFRRLKLKNVVIEQAVRGFSMAPVNRQGTLSNSDPTGCDGEARSTVCSSVWNCRRKFRGCTTDKEKAMQISNAPSEKPRKESESNAKITHRCMNLCESTAAKQIYYGSSLELVKYYRPSTDHSGIVRYQSPGIPTPIANQYRAILSVGKEQFKQGS